MCGVLAGWFVAGVADDLGGEEGVDAVVEGVAESVGHDDEVSAVGAAAEPESSVAAGADGTGPDQAA